jgi:hypothetical protein
LTHFLVEGLGPGQADLDGDGQISLAELHQWLAPRIARAARRATMARARRYFVRVRRRL